MAESFGALLRDYRRAAGLTQEALAERAALTGQAVGALERGDRRFPRRDTVARLAVALGLTDDQRTGFMSASRRAIPRSPTSPDTAPQSASVSPGQLPAAVAQFVGRDAHLKAMNELLGHSSTVVVSAVSGMAGIGKTAFAVHWAHQAREQFPDGQLYVNLRGFHPGRAPMSHAVAVRAFLESLGVPPRRWPSTLDAQVGLYRSLLAGRRMLIVLDNAYDAEQVRPLLPGAPGCLALVTSRNQLTSLAASDGARLIALDVLAVDEAHELLAARLGEDRVSAEPHAIEEIVIRCARLPLALAIVAARAAAQPQFSLAALADEVAKAQGSLDAFHSRDAATNVRTVFSWSYQSLGPAAARLFRLLGLHPGPDIAVPAVASLTGLSSRRVRPLLAELTCANLIVEHSPGRFTLHDLVRVYAAERAHADEPEDERHLAIGRLLDHYLHTAYTADRLLSPARESIVLGRPRPGTAPECPADHDQAMAWFSAECSTLLAAVDYASSLGFDIHVWQLAWVLTCFLSRAGRWEEDVTVQRAALTAACRVADPAAQARAHRLLALDCTQLGRFDEADTHFGSALDLAMRAEDPVAQARAHIHFAMGLERQGRYGEALHHAQRALVLYRAAGHRSGQADALNGVGWIHAQRGAHQAALDSCEQALSLHLELDDRPGQAASWDSLGFAHHHLGQHDQAVTCYRHAVELHGNLGNRYYTAESLVHLGDTHHTTGDVAAARTAWHRALHILTELDHHDAGQVQARLHRLDSP